MTEFKEKLHAFIQHYERLNVLSEEGEDGFNSEFIQLKQETQQYKDNNTFPAEAGQQPYNKKKNRFKDILPYEYTRVQLHKSAGIEGSDYINANYIQGADGNVTYIAAQGPLPHTVEDFWKMLWYHQIEIVVMACKLVEMGRKKCEQYWPPVGESQMYGPIKVTMTNEESISTDFTVRELLAECQGESQVVRQYHYNAWPDHGRPSSALPIIRMVERIGDHRKRRDIPIVVHCSAGCGRTGTIIAIDFAKSLLSTEDLNDELNVFSIVHEMRKQRPSMVQAKEQYIFVYLAIIEMIKRILDNVPQAPPKQLNFEKKESPPTQSPVVEGIYVNVNVSESSTNDEKQELSSSVKLPPHPKPIMRTSSGGANSEGKPSPPTKPKLKSKPELPNKPELPSKPETPPKKDVPEPTPRRKSGDNAPVPSPRKPSPLPPLSSSTPTTTPTSTSTPNNKGYINVPSTGDGVATPNTKGYINVPGSSDGTGGMDNSTYSVVQKSSTLPGRSTGSTPKNTSNTSILDMLMSECGDVLSEKDKKEISGSASDEQTSYSLLDSVKEDELPPDIPVKTVEAMQLLIGDVTPAPPSPTAATNSMIYETPDLTNQPPLSTSLAFSSTLPSSPQKPPQPTQEKRSKGPSGLFKNRAKDKAATTSHTPLGKTASTSSVPSPSKRSGSSQTVPAKRPGQSGSSSRVVNDKYHFPGDIGFGIRVGKPKGPRQCPSHWSIPNGLIH